MQSQRIKSLSTRYLGFYKNSVLVVLVGVMLFFIFSAVQAIRGDKRYVSPITTTVYFGFLTYGWIRINRNVYPVEFDEKYLYVILPSQDMLIPLENIKEVEIKTLGGVYEVELYTAEQLGKKFYFKPSLLYPFNYKRKDDLVNVLRKYINQAQARKQHFQANALHS
jgi:hypothetical protein